MTVRTGVIPGNQISADEQRRLAVDDAMPAKVIRPGDSAEMAHAIEACDQAGTAAVIWGGGTQMSMGTPPRRYEVALSTERLTRLLEYEPGDLTCRVEAGLRVAELQKTLHARGQRLPLDPPHPARATVGGMVAANSNGLGRARHGTVRDWVIGIAVAYPSGKVARAGGKVVKNVAGYDLMKLHTGAFGTLGVIAEVNFKVQTMPEAELTVLGHFEDPAAALKAGVDLAHRYLAPAAMIVVDRAALWTCGFTADWHWTLAVKLEGYAREIEPAQEGVAAIVRAAGGRVEGQGVPPTFWNDARDWSSPADKSDVVLYGMTSLTGLARLLPIAAEGGSWMVQPGAGVFHVRVSPEAAAALLERLRGAAGDDGQVVVARAPVSLKRGLDVWGPPPPGFPLMRSLKDSLDPKGTLNPGRFVGGL